MPKSNIRGPKAPGPQGIGGLSISDDGRDGPGTIRSLRENILKLKVLAIFKKLHMYRHLLGTL
jgi:hypothetical protein